MAVEARPLPRSRRRPTRPLRVVYFLRADSGRLASGVTTQVRQYVKAVEAQGGQALVHAGSGLPEGRFDVAHVFNVDWALEAGPQTRLAERVADQVVLSPVHHPLKWVEAYHRSQRRGLAAAAADVLPLSAYDSVRDVVMALTQPRLLPAALGQLGRLRASQRRILETADLWAVAAEAEVEAIEEDFAVGAKATVVVPNAADYDDAPDAVQGLPEGFVLCVARVEARKNQLSLARALNEIGLPGVFVGQPNPRHRAYVREFAELVEQSANLQWLQLERAEILRLYKRARLYVLPSFFEVFSLADAEAAFAGTPILTTAHNFSAELLGEHARYWSPETGYEGLLTELAHAVEMERDLDFRDELRAQHGWGPVCDRLLGSYHDLLETS